MHTYYGHVEPRNIFGPYMNTAIWFATNFEPQLTEVNVSIQEDEKNHAYWELVKVRKREVGGYSGVSAVWLRAGKLTLERAMQLLIS